MEFKYAIARGWFKSVLHYAYGDKWYQKMMRARRCVLKGRKS